MDTSPEYILQCEKAEEIQKAWQPKKWDLYQQTPEESWEKPFIWAVLPEEIADSGVYGRVFVDEKGGVTFDTGEKIIWLPRQYQLQEVAKEENWSGPLLSLYAFINNEDVDKSWIRSMEQLWLAFVMFKKYQKQWTGKEWEKIEEENK